VALISVVVAVSPPIEAQRAWEWQALAVATVADTSFFGGGLGLGYRTDGRMRLDILASVGDRADRIAFRPEAVLSFHLNPYKREGVSPYAAAGVAFVINQGNNEQYLLASLGLEWRPGRNWGWFLEAGFGGGVRIAGGVQLRKRPRRR
jgi:hypothetical protein